MTEGDANAAAATAGKKTEESSFIVDSPKLRDALKKKKKSELAKQQLYAEDTQLL